MSNQIYYANQAANPALGLRAYEGYEVIPEHLERNLTSQQRRFLDNYVFNKSPQEIEELKAVEQGSERWRMARVGLITASKMGEAVGLSSYEAPDDTAYKMVYVPFLGNDATEWGKKHEPVACDRYVQDQRKALWNAMQRAWFAEEKTVDFLGQKHDMPDSIDDLSPVKVFDVRASGLNIDLLAPWRGCSLDGTICVMGKPVGVLEIKCPHKKGPYGSVPLHYYCQVQANMHISQLPICDFYVWSPNKGITCDTLHYDAYYTNTRMMPDVRSFYFTKLLPHMVKKQLTVDPTLSGGKICDVVADAKAAGQSTTAPSTGRKTTSTAGRGGGRGRKRKAGDVTKSTMSRLDLFQQTRPT